MYKLGYTYRFNKWKKVYQQDFKGLYAGKEIHHDFNANVLISKALQSQQPFLVSRLGSVETSIMYNALLYSFTKVKWDKQLVYALQNNAGFFPISERNLEQFVSIYSESLREVDIMGIWFNEGERELCNQFCPKAEFIHLKAIEPYYHGEPWSALLEGRTVLVIHPFEQSIRNQYAYRRLQLFENKKVLPDFELKTIKAVQSIAGNQTGHASWFEALTDMYDRISNTNFDIAIVGAGAYGLPLGAHIKKLGKQAIHMGGATQILFGIRGKRWEENPDVKRFFNSYWKRPEECEVPKNAVNVENACYW